MKKTMNKSNRASKKAGRINGKLSFSKEAERRFFFIMTMIMLLLGIIIKMI